MRLLLSSYILSGDAARPAVLPSADPAAPGRAAVVVNALDEYGDGRTRNLGRETRCWEAFGYRCEELDLRDYFSAPDELPARLAALDLVWAMGGNAFVLGRAVARSGLGAALRAQAHRPEFVYGGYSAGACVAGPDLQGIDLIDDPNVLPEGYDVEFEPACMNLVPFRIVPHWRSDHPESDRAEIAAASLAERGLEHRCLRDGDIIEIQDAAVGTA
jgi:dipeptidase E